MYTLRVPPAKLQNVPSQMLPVITVLSELIAINPTILASADIRLSVRIKGHAFRCDKHKTFNPAKASAVKGGCPDCEMAVAVFNKATKLADLLSPVK